jgi:hypothetical protein
MQEDDSHDWTSFCTMLLRDDPKPARSIHLELDTEDAAGLFECFLLFMSTALAKWYGKPVDLKKVTDLSMQRLAQYYASFGIQFMCIIAPEPDIYSINNKNYLNETSLDKMVFQATAAGKLYTIRFRFIEA